MKNKKGFLRIVEAFVAIILIGGVMGFIYFQKIQNNKQEDVAYQLIRVALKEISNNPDLREVVINAYNQPQTDPNWQKINKVIGEIVTDRYDFYFRVCELESSCGIDINYDFDKQIFSEEVSVSSTFEGYEPKKIRIFVWER